MQAPNVSVRAVRKFKLVWAASWTIKFAVLMAFVLIVVALVGGR